MRRGFLCRLDDIPAGGAKGVVIGAGAERQDIILLRRGGTVTAFENRCPHMGTPLETFPDRFLNQTGELLICSTHGARFQVADGACVEGPCKGQALSRVRVRISGGNVILDDAIPDSNRQKSPIRRAAAHTTKSVLRTSRLKDA